jgi:RHS repeat-associated protein
VYFHPYGGIRWSQSGGNAISPTSSTRRTYTGQYDIGFWAGSLMHYNARQYSPYLNRFIQPDTIVPDPGNQQALNRYSYALGNPLKYTDPSGHTVICAQQCEEQLDQGYKPSNSAIQNLLFVLNNYYVAAEQRGQITALEGMASLVDTAAAITPSCVECVVRNVGMVLTGLELGVAAWHELHAQRGLLDRNERYETGPKLGQSGFSPMFQDPKEGFMQPHHYWFYVMLGYEDLALTYLPLGGAIALYHDGLETGAPGKSYQDFALAIEGLQAGNGLATGSIPLSQAGNFMRTTLAPGSDAAMRWYLYVVYAQYYRP